MPLVVSLVQPQARATIHVENAPTEIGVGETRAPGGDFGELTVDADPEEELDAASQLRIGDEAPRITLLDVRPSVLEGAT